MQLDCRKPKELLAVHISVFTSVCLPAYMLVTKYKNATWSFKLKQLVVVCESVRKHLPLCYIVTDRKVQLSQGKKSRTWSKEKQKIDAVSVTPLLRNTC